MIHYCGGEPNEKGLKKTRKELYKLYKDKILDSDIAENKDNIRKADITEYKYNIEDLGHKNYNKEKTSHVTGYWKKTGVSGYRRINNDFNENSEYNELLKTAEWKRRAGGRIYRQGTQVYVLRERG